jgi:hypothetical protein
LRWMSFKMTLIKLWDCGFVVHFDDNAPPSFHNPLMLLLYCQLL